MTDLKGASAPRPARTASLSATIASSGFIPGARIRAPSRPMPLRGADRAERGASASFCCGDVLLRWWSRSSWAFGSTRRGPPAPVAPRPAARADLGRGRRRRRPPPRRPPLTAFGVVADGTSSVRPPERTSARTHPRRRRGRRTAAPPAPKPRLYHWSRDPRRRSGREPISRIFSAGGSSRTQSGIVVGCASRADQVGSGRATPRRRDLRGAAQPTPQNPVNPLRLLAVQSSRSWGSWPAAP